jgi:glycosyltransferase involved in cell wall biosynthesis
MATVDVVIPAFNAARFLPAALESVARQTFDDWQIVLIDDGSTDNTAEVVAPYMERFGSKLRYIRQKNQGLPAARNAAIRASDSEFLALLDADDEWLPRRLEESVRVLRERPAAGLAYGLITYIDAEGNKLHTFEGNRRVVEGRVAPAIYMRRIELPCPTITFRRSCVEAVGVFDETMRSTEDRDLWLRIALRYEVAFVPEVLAYYRLSPNQMSTNAQRMMDAQMQFIRKHYGAEGCGWVPRQVSRARAYKQRADALKAQGRSWAALRSSLQALAMYPFDAEHVRAAASLLAHCVRGGERGSGER